MGTPAAVKVGPGLLYVAPIGTTEPTNPSATLPSANWLPVGYTEDGHTFTTETTMEDVEVAEELDPILVVATKRVTSLELQLAEMSITNWSIAHNGGTIGSPTSGFVSFEPPDLGDEVRLMIFWQSDDLQSALLGRKCLSSGAVAVPRKKAPAKSVIPIRFRLEKPTGAKTHKIWENDDYSYDDPHT